MITGRHLGARSSSDSQVFDTFAVQAEDVTYVMLNNDGMTTTVQRELDDIERRLEDYILKSEAITMIQLMEEYEYNGEIMSGLLVIYGDDDPSNGFEHRIFIPIEGGFGVGQSVNLVLQNLTNNNNNYPIVLVYQPGQSSGTEGSVNFTDKVMVNPSSGSITASGTVTATSFVGNASTASKFNEAKTIIIDLSREANTNSFVGDSTTTFGIKNILPISHGGTGVSDTSRLTCYGVCASTSAASALTVTASGFTPVNGAQICVYFTNNHTHSTPTLKINGTGAALTMYNSVGERLGGSSFVAGMYHFVYYDGALYQCRVIGLSGGEAESANSLTTSRLIDGIPFNGTDDVSHYLKDNGSANFTIDCNTYPQAPYFFSEAPNGTFVNIELSKDYSYDPDYGLQVNFVNNDTSLPIVTLKFNSDNKLIKQGVYNFVKTLSGLQEVGDTESIYSYNIESAFPNTKHSLLFKTDNNSEDSVLSATYFNPKVYAYQDDTSRKSVLVADLFSGTVITATTADALTTSRNIDGFSFDGSLSINRLFNGEDNASSTTKKVINPNPYGTSSYEMVRGAWFFFKLNNDDTSASTTVARSLQVDSTTAKPIKYNGAEIKEKGILKKDTLYKAVYDGSHYIVTDEEAAVPDVSSLTNIPNASATVEGIMRLYTDLNSSNTNGTVTQSVIKTALAAKADTGSVISTATTIEGVYYDSSTSFSHLASVTSVASATAITASLAGYKLVKGARAYFEFESDDASTVSNTARTLSINGTTAKNIYYNGVQVKTGKFFKAGIIYEVIYDGTGYNVINPADYKWYGSCTTASGTAAKTVTILSGYKEIAGQKITVTFTKGSSVANATLNVNGLGAKPIYYRGSAITASNLLTANGTYEFVFDGTNYILIGDLDTNTIAEDVTIETATSSVAGVMKLYTDLSSSKTDGTVTQSAIKTALDGKLSTTTNVAQVAMVAASSTNGEYPVLFKNATTTSSATSTVLFKSGITINPSTSSITATTFKGTATSATTAVSATTATSATKLAAARKIDGVSFDGSSDVTRFGSVASTVAATATTKTVSGLTNLTVATGAHFIVKFINGHSATSLTLSVNGTSKVAKYNNSAIGSGIITANSTCEFVYDGTNFVLIGIAAGTASSTNAGVMKLYSSTGTNTDGTITQSQITELLASKLDETGTVATAEKADKLDTTNNINGLVFTGERSLTNYAECTTAAGTQVKAITLNTNTSFTLQTGSQVTVRFKYTNTKDNPKLQVNSTTAVAIQYRGYAIPASALQKDSIYTFVYTGSVWEIVGSVLWTEG